MKSWLGNENFILSNILKWFCVKTSMRETFFLICSFLRFAGWLIHESNKLSDVYMRILCAIPHLKSQITYNGPEITYHGPGIELTKIFLLALGPSLSYYECQVSSLGRWHGWDPPSWMKYLSVNWQFFLATAPSKKTFLITKPQTKGIISMTLTLLSRPQNYVLTLFPYFTKWRHVMCRWLRQFFRYTMRTFVFFVQCFFCTLWVPLFAENRLLKNSAKSNR